MYYALTGKELDINELKPVLHIWIGYELSLGAVNMKCKVSIMSKSQQITARKVRGKKSSARNGEHGLRFIS